jgi:hypothetical protein
MNTLPKVIEMSRLATSISEPTDIYGGDAVFTSPPLIEPQSTAVVSPVNLSMAADSPIDLTSTYMPETTVAADIAPDPVGQTISPDEMLTVDELAEHASYDAAPSKGSTRTWLYRLPFEAVGAKYPDSKAAMLVSGIENWFLVLLAVGLALGTWWMLKKK